MTSRLALFAAFLLALPLLAGSRDAEAAAYVFSSSGSFTDCSGCDIATGQSKIGWGGSKQIDRNNYDGSTMTAVAVNGSGNLPKSTVKIGELDWLNKATPSDNTADTVTAAYKLTLDFSQPGPGGSNSDTFALTIINTPNNMKVCFLFYCQNNGNRDDTGTLTGYSPSFIVDGLLISNITFSENGDGTYDPATHLWSNPEGELSRLSIFADITVVPEPMSLALLGAGLVGLGAVRRRRRAASPV